MKIEAIGKVYSTRKEVADDNWNQESVYIELNDEYPSEALNGLEDFSHAEILFFMDQVDPEKIETSARHPRNNLAWPKVGIFAQRGKNRPNQMGLTVCEILKVEGGKIFLKGLDAVDGTPVLDIKPWMKEFAPQGICRQPAWSSELMSGYWEKEKTPRESTYEEVQLALKDQPESAELNYLAAKICDAHRTEAEAVPYRGKYGQCDYKFFHGKGLLNSLL